jgi:hypothetical protein
MASTSEICSSISYHLLEFEQLKNEVKQRKLRGKETWKPPPEDLYKINVDAFFEAETKKGGWGFIVRNKAGDFLEGGAGNLSRVACPLQAEALAALFSLQRAVHLGMTEIILETDASVLDPALDSEEMDRGPYGALFRQIRELIRLHFSVYKIYVCSRVCNKVVDCVKPRVMETIIKSLKLQLSLKVRENQVIEV